MLTKSNQQKWWQTWAIYLRPEALRMLFLGFSAGLPYVLVVGTLSRRLAEAGVDRSTIGYLSWVGLAYAFKWMWSPFVDQVRIPFLTKAIGRRRSWLLVSQALIVLGIVGMARADLQNGLDVLVWCAVLVAFASATQDIALDAFRIESADIEFQAALSATYQSGYRLAMIWAGAGVLWIAAYVQGDDTGAQQYAWITSASMKGEFWKSTRLMVMGNFYDASAWTAAYMVMALSMLVGVLTVVFSAEPARSQQAAHERAQQIQLYKHLPLGQRIERWVMMTMVEPFADFIQRYKWQALIVLGLIGLYRISDMVMGVMSGPFYADMGYTKNEVAAASKIYGVIMTLLGTFIGGVLVLRAGVFRILMLGAFLSAATNVLFAWLAFRGHDFYALIAVISMDNLSAGIASAAFIGYLSSLTNIKFSATQYALFSSMMILAPKFVSGFTGAFVDHYSYATFFMCTAMLGLPVLVLVWLASKVHEPAKVIAWEEKNAGKS